jgi:hypothetical protein
MKTKIKTNQLIITQADKGKTLVILTQEDYKHKTYNFAQDNQFTTINNKPTQHYQKIVEQTLK